MTSRRQISTPSSGRYRQVSLYCVSLDQKGWQAWLLTKYLSSVFSFRTKKNNPIFQSSTQDAFYHGSCILIMALGYMYTRRQVKYRQISNISHTVVANKIVDHTDVVGASIAALLQLYLHYRLNTGVFGLHKDTCKPRRETFQFWDRVRLVVDIWRYFTTWCLQTSHQKLNYSVFNKLCP